MILLKGPHVAFGRRVVPKFPGIKQTSILIGKMCISIGARKSCFPKTTDQHVFPLGKKANILAICFGAILGLGQFSTEFPFLVH